MGKRELATLFSSDPDRYYRVPLFDNKGFKRQMCSICGKHYWSIIDRLACPDHENYSFIGNPPTKKRLDYVNAWKEVEKFFVANDHSIVRRYPVVCRWRDDLYFTIASIVDFQRVMGNKVVFELPSNPLVVPQMCLRFNDIENVGISGRHFTGFCMIGQTCKADSPGGYWKEKCIELDFGLLTSGLGIPAEEITFVEDVWMGAGAFGYSLEYFVRGLELGNAVFTEFEGNEDSYSIMQNKIIDMGAGLERFSWITMGTPTSYDCAFGPVTRKLLELTDVQGNSDLLGKYFGSISSLLDNSGADIHILRSRIAADLGISLEELTKTVSPFEAIYTIADHTRTLLFAISDGSLPSNVGGGYNLRVILRRALSILRRFEWNISLEDIADMHVDYLKQMYPELEGHRDDIRTILQIETNRYFGSRERMYRIANTLHEKRLTPSVDDLIRMYESDGITPDLLVETGAIEQVPATFYTRLAELHSSESESKVLKPLYGIDNLDPTRLLYYEDESIREFSARILRIVDNKFVILDKTAFYPRGGGQEPDKGKINGQEVVEVIKQGNIVVHRLKSCKGLIEGRVVEAKVDSKRRDLITKHHTATHILNTSARKNLGSWVWQNSAFKEENYGRLDITHHSSLTKEEVERIETTANQVIRENLPVTIKFYERGDAEQMFSFRIYQGGVVPSSDVRIVNVEGWDIEACGGTHVKRTGNIGIIKILKSERIQDGVVRLEFVAGDAAVEFIQRQETQLALIAQLLGSSKEKAVESVQKSIEEANNAKRKSKIIIRKITPSIVQAILRESVEFGRLKIYKTYDDELDDDFHISIGEKAVEIEPSLVYIALIQKGQGIRVIVFAGKNAQEIIKAGEISKKLSGLLGGSGGGDARFGQGGGRAKDKIQTSLSMIDSIISSGIK